MVKWSLTSLKTKESKCARVQRCRVCVQLNTHPSSAWAGFAPKLTVTLAVAGTKLCLTPHSGSSSCTHGRPPQNNSKPCKCPSLRCSCNWPPCTWHLLGEIEATHCKRPCAPVRFPEDLFIMFDKNLSQILSNGSARCRSVDEIVCVLPVCTLQQLIWVLYRNLRQCSATSSLPSRAISRCLLRVLRILQLLLLLQISAD